MFIIGHPRSGSTNLIKYLSWKLSKDMITWNLDEFFYSRCPHLWGDFNKIYLNDFNYIDSLTLFSMKENINLEILKSNHILKLLKSKNNLKFLESTHISDRVRNLFLDKIEISFQNKKEAVNWRDQELSKRIKFIKTLEEKKFDYVTKIFFEDSCMLNFKFPKSESVILYRQNISESVFSAIIKKFHHENNKLNKDFDDRVKNLIPFYKINLGTNELEKFLFPHIKLLIFIKNNPEINAICYEDIYQTNKDVSIRYKDTQILLDKTSLGKKIDYSRNKKEYFYNYEKYKNLFWKIIKDNSLNFICEKYYINFS